MNFFAHATLALWRSDAPRFVFGSMLPDFAGMLGVRVLRVDDAELASGVAFHHATDAAFHQAPAFVGLCEQGILTLEAAGVGRGTARAVAHVGTELLLDGALSHDQRALQVYATTLATAQRERFVQSLALPAPEHSERFHLALGRLANAPVPHGYRDPAFVVARLRGALERRPRLAIRDQDVVSVERFVRDIQPRVERVWPQLREQVRAGLTPNTEPAHS